MQPTTPPPQPATPVPAPPKPRNRRARLFLALAAGILSLLCLGGIGVIISLYDEATEIKRTSPDVVVSSYLRAYLINRDDQQASLFTCKSGANLAQVSNLRDELVAREKEFDVSVSVNWGALAVAANGSSRSVTTELTIVGSANGQPVSQRTEPWRFELIEEDGWRVCGAAKVS
ncbi:hypothetical protein [Pseudosporangium ferrugineum]|uniref:hypothetical protein n=1 Tax=Pseudosporangium ferrugineum TaxID=439699 RepID=UPI000D05FD6F|nr:hypothetical protein [Pseudosporangium ferrugineum]